MDLGKIKTLIDLVSGSNISELEITEADSKVRIVKTDPPVVSYGAVAAAASVAAQPLAAVSSPVEPPPSGYVVTSPMVGTFYRSSSPGGKPLVEVGDAVKEGAPLCIIEAMKIMNEIEADKSGNIVQIFCQDGQAVEFSQPMFIIE